MIIFGKSAIILPACPCFLQVIFSVKDFFIRANLMPSPVRMTRSKVIFVRFSFFAKRAICERSSCCPSKKLKNVFARQNTSIYELIGQLKNATNLCLLHSIISCVIADNFVLVFVNLHINLFNLQ